MPIETFKSIRLTQENGVAQLLLCQGQRGNPVDAEMCAELCEVATLLAHDPGVRAVLLTAEGPNFSVGGDVSMFVEYLDTLPSQIARWTADLHVGLARLQRMDAPIVVAVQGMCVGGMVGIAAGADIVIANSEARFVAAYPKIGFCCDAGTSVMLSRRMGLSKARKFLLLNETLQADAAASAGLVDEVVDPLRLNERAAHVAAQLAEGPTRAFGEIRRLMLSAATEPLETQLELEAQGLSRIAATHDAREGLSAFAEKRSAKFEGR
ncbi:enoyl-CoA hydratase/isomerase family protein [Altererythrobacter sp. BO-6]|uniref:enoyl-CoA hydratase/isomerase family protein n=1 Tax=Altererythrobacter sp. BO-6 TaxID=2604537 RepID=UPI0013E1C560|nr:enoyl-CoA hydratase/isomerase family protein [Altererythrobacter sp. BO-6]QIG54732.1 enoyl-CoA hydratase/isomerase family protein [Altererythrobacter sp. BO-6]